MNKYLHIWLFAILGTLLASTALSAQDVITMTTSKGVEKAILLKAVVDDDVSIEGTLKNREMNEDGFKFYTAKNQTITIRGDITEPDYDENQLTCLNVSKSTALELFDCSRNQLASLDVLKDTALETLYCNNNKLASLDVSKNTALNLLYYNNSRLTNLNISGCARLRIIACGDNHIKGRVMTKLVNSLPDRRGMYCGIIYLVDRSSKKKDRNSCSDADVTISKKKSWRIL